MSAQVRQRRTQRGISMVFALVVVFIVLAISLTIFGDAINTASNSGGVQAKNSAFDAASAGLDAAIFALDRDKTLPPGPCPTPGGSLNDVSFDCHIAANQLNKLAPASAADPGVPGTPTLVVPPKTAYIYASVSSGGRRTYAEAIVTRASPMPFPAAGVNAQRDVFYAFNPTTVTVVGDVRSDASIYWNLAGSSPLVPPVIGGTYAATIDQLPGIGGTNEGQSTVTFPTPSQMLQFQANAKALAQATQTMSASQALISCVGNNNVGGCSGNIYVPGNLNIVNSIAFVGGGTVYVDGDVTISGLGALWNVGVGTIVVAGKFTATGQSAYFNSTNLGELVVFGKDSSPLPSPSPFPAQPAGLTISLQGLSTPAGLIYAPFGSVLLSGSGLETGSINAGTTPLQSGGDIFLYGGGAVGGFARSVLSASLFDGELRTTAYWEY